MIGRLSIFAIFLGLIASTFAVLLIGVIGGVILAASSPSDVEWFASPVSAPPSTGILALILAGYFGGALAAGYTSARHAIGDELINASATGIALLFLSVASYEEVWLRQIPLWCTMAIIGLLVPASLLGGYLQRGKAAH